MGIVSRSQGGSGSGASGGEIGYAQITAPVNVVSLVEATGTTIIAPGAFVFDGAPVMCQFFAPFCVLDSAGTGDLFIVSLFEGASQLGRLVVVNSWTITTQPRLPLNGFLRFTPSAASHTYTVTAHVTSTTGTPSVQAGAGGTGASVPAFVRFTKV